jgi:hypothetical protein
VSARRDARSFVRMEDSGLDGSGQRKEWEVGSREWLVLYDDTSARGDVLDGDLDRGEGEHISRSVHVVDKLDHGDACERCVNKASSSQHEICEGAARGIARLLPAAVLRRVLAVVRIVGCVAGEGKREEGVREKSLRRWGAGGGGAA